MLKKRLEDLIKEIIDDDTVRLDYTKDIRIQGVDSIQVIKFLAITEESFGIDFEYDFLDKNPVLSIDVIGAYIENRK